MDLPSTCGRVGKSLLIIVNKLNLIRSALVSVHTMYVYVCLSVH